jgi:hypothetical protein
MSAIVSGAMEVRSDRTLYLPVVTRCCVRKIPDRDRLRVTTSVCNNYMITDENGKDVSGDNHYSITAESANCRHYNNIPKCA